MGLVNNGQSGKSEGGAGRLPPEAERALKEAEERRRALDAEEAAKPWR